MKEMKTITILGNTYEVIDDDARTSISDISKRLDYLDAPEVITSISITEATDGTVTMVNALKSGSTQTVVITPDANGNPVSVTVCGEEIPITWTKENEATIE